MSPTFVCPVTRSAVDIFSTTTTTSHSLVGWLVKLEGGGRPATLVRRNLTNNQYCSNYCLQPAVVKLEEKNGSNTSKISSIAAATTAVMSCDDDDASLTKQSTKKSSGRLFSQSLRSSLVERAYMQPPPSHVSHLHLQLLTFIKMSFFRDTQSQISPGCIGFVQMTISIMSNIAIKVQFQSIYYS